MDFKDLIINKLKSAFPDALLDVYEHRGEIALIVNAKKIVQICTFLKEDNELDFNYCEDVTAIDWGRRKNRFTMVYHIYSIKNNFRLRLKADLEGDTCDSVTSVWGSANWYERETFDMYGIKFNNHPDPRRMYLPEDFEYYPLRKEFPLMGIPGSFTLPKK